MSYGANPDDLLLGDLVLGSTDAERYINAAADEMDSLIGQRYQLPINLAGIAQYAQKLLKLIEINLASGRLIMARAQGGEDSELHAYGHSLVKRAMADLHAIATGQIKLSGAPFAHQSTTTRGPGIVNQDARSAVSAFEDFAFGRDPLATWRPGR